MKAKGRHWTMLWMLVFLATAMVIVGRQKSALATSRRLVKLESERTALDGKRTELEQAIHRAMSREVLVPLAERKLGLILPGGDNSTSILVEPPSTPRR